MTASLRWRIAVTALATSAAALLAVLVLVGPGLRQRATDEMRERLLAEAKLVARVVEQPSTKRLTPGPRRLWGAFAARPLFGVLFAPGWRYISR